MPHVPYDDFADIYDAWCDSVPITKQNLPFYVELMAASSGVVVELGVGNGRICIEVAKRGRRVVGVDSSEGILELCRTRAIEAGMEDRLELVSGDFRDFEIPEPAEVITMPFHAIGHLLTKEDKLIALRNVHRQLVSGGRFVFDHFIFDPDYPIPPGLPHLRAETVDPETGRKRLLWETSIRDASRQVIRVFACTEDLDDDGTVVNRRYRKTDISWMAPEQSRELLEETGFEVEAVYGDFTRAPLEVGSPEQVWIARKPIRDSN
jgi:ubiquinone/menaquinone biosynthesis C-methylase UbiE